MINKILSEKLTKQYSRKNGILEITVFDDEDGYFIRIDFRKSIVPVEFIVDEVGLKIIMEYSIMEFRRLENRIVMIKPGSSINLTTLIAIDCGYKVEEVKNITLSKKMDFRVSSLIIHRKSIRPNLIYHETANIEPILSFKPKRLDDYSKNVYKILDTCILEFKNPNNIVQMKVDFDVISNLNLNGLSPSYRFNESKWRVSYIHEGKKTKIHRYITNCPKDMVVDHINRDPMDNRLINLRIVSMSVNMHNMGSKNNSEFIKGVTINNKSIYARITVDGKHYSKLFSIKKYGLEKAIEMATLKRREWNKKFNVEEA